AADQTNDAVRADARCRSDVFRLIRAVEHRLGKGRRGSVERGCGLAAGEQRLELGPKRRVVARVLLDERIPLRCGERERAVSGGEYLAPTLRREPYRWVVGHRGGCLGLNRTRRIPCRPDIGYRNRRLFIRACDEASP